MSKMFFKDSLTVEVPRLTNAQQELLNGPSPSIDVIIDATFAGIMSGRNVLYRPNRVREATPSFVTPYLKPVLLNHDRMRDPIGRVYSSEYMDTSSELIARFPDLRNLYEDNASLKSLQKSIKVIMSLQDLSPDYSGVGKVRVHARILDEDAIRKFSNGLYLTVSSAGDTNDAICSICGQSWKNDGPCDHETGKIYDGIFCGLIFDKLDYEELSVATVPALKPARVVEISTKDFKGSIIQQDALPIDKVSLYIRGQKKNGSKSIFSFGDTKDEDVLAMREEVKDLHSLLSDTEEQDMPKEEKVLDYQLIADSLKELGMEDKVLSAGDREKLAASTFCGPDRSFPVPDCSHVKAALNRLGQGFPKGASQQVKDRIRSCVNGKAKKLGCGGKAQDSKDFVNAKEYENFKFLTYNSLFSDSVASYEIVSEFLDEDKRLTVEQLKALSDDKFLGPHRTLPTVDKDHIQAIADSLNALQDKDAESDVAKLVKKDLEKLLKVETKVEDNKETPDVEKLKEQVQELSDAIELFKNRLVVKERENSELEHVNDSLVQDYKGLLVDFNLMLKRITGSTEKPEEISTELVSRTIDSLKDSIKDMKSEFEKGKVKVEDAKPETKIEDQKVEDVKPEVKPEDKVHDQKVEPDPTLSIVNPPVDDNKKKYAHIYMNWSTIKDEKGPVAASRYLIQMKARGFVPLGLMFE